MQNDAREEARVAGSKVDAVTRLDERFRDVVASAPDRVALIAGDTEYTYAEIDRWSDAIACDVAACDAPPDRPVAIMTSSPVVLVPSMLGVVKAGHFFVMIDAIDSEDRIALVLRESNAALLLVDAGAHSPVGSGEIPSVGIQRLPNVVSSPPPSRSANPYLYVIYTSGTTGKPKGLATKHDGAVPNFLEHAARLGYGPDVRRSYTALPGYARATNATFQALLTGTTMCTYDARSESFEALADSIARNRIDVLDMSPSLFRSFVRSAGEGLDLSSVRTLRLSADRVTLADVDAFRRLFPRESTLYLGFASSETGAIFGMRIEHDTPIPGPLVPIGRPNKRVEVRLLDDDGNEVPDGETGEIVVRSPFVAEGYWNDPELTKERFTIDPEDAERRTFRTGDLARRDENGLYYFVGRKDARLKIHGRRIDPSEVEAALVACDGIREAVIVSRTDERGDELLVAFVVMNEGQRLTPRAVRAQLRETMPRWMIPSRIHEIDSIPMTGAAKVDRDALAARDDDLPIEKNPKHEPPKRTFGDVWSRLTRRNVKRR